MKAKLANEPELKVDVWSCGKLDWGENPRDADMVSTAENMGYIMEGKITHMTREVVFSHDHRYKITQVLDYSHRDRIILFDQTSCHNSASCEFFYANDEALECCIKKGLRILGVVRTAFNKTIKELDDSE